MSDKDTLLPCPRCNARATFYENKVDFEPKASVRCTECGIGFDCCADTITEAAELWNTRAAMTTASTIPTDGGYRDAFYELAGMMDIGARPYSPKETWERVMKPRLAAALSIQTISGKGMREMVESNLTDDDLAAWAEQAKRDDWHLRFVGSDIRQLIGEVQRCRAALVDQGERG